MVRQMIASTAYQAYLQSPAWQRKRDAVRKRSQGTCERCFARPGIDVHHITYERIGQELLTDLIHLCRVCHDKAHSPHSIEPWELEEIRRARLAAEPTPSARKIVVLEWYQYGIISAADVFFWFYLFDLDHV